MAMAGERTGNFKDTVFMSGTFLLVFLLAWHLFTLREAFDPKGLTQEQLQTMEFNGDIARTPDGGYVWNPEKEKVTGDPGPLAGPGKSGVGLAGAFGVKGTNGRGIPNLGHYTATRFGAR